MDKFDEYLNNKTKSEKEEFRLPKSFERGLEETLENLGEENKIKEEKWYFNKKIWTTAACFVFIFLAGISLKYNSSLSSNESRIKSLENQADSENGDYPEIANYSGTDSRSVNDDSSGKGVSEFSLQDTISNLYIDYSNINKIIIKEMAESNTYKSVDNKNDIISIIEFINNISKEEIQRQELNDWDFLIQTNGVDSNYSIIFQGNIINIDDKYYKIDSQEVTNLKNIYDTLNYSKDNIPYCDF